MREILGLYKYLIKLQPKNRHIIIHGDNLGMIQDLWKHSSKTPKINKVIQKIFTLLRDRNNTTEFIWLRRDSLLIELADALSKDNSSLIQIDNEIKRKYNIKNLYFPFNTLYKLYRVRKFMPWNFVIKPNKGLKLIEYCTQENWNLHTIDCISQKTDVIIIGIENWRANEELIQFLIIRKWKGIFISPNFPNFGNNLAIRYNKMFVLKESRLRRIIFHNHTRLNMTYNIYEFDCSK